MTHAWKNRIFAGLLIGTGFAQLSCAQANVTTASEDQKVKQVANTRIKMNEELSYTPVDEATAFKELKSYVIEWKYGRKGVPTRLDPAHVEKFLREKVDRSLHSASFERARRVVDYYDLVSVLDHFDKMLDRKEGESRQFQQSVESIMMLAQVGDSTYREKAAAYFQYLVGHKLATEHYEKLAGAVDAFGPELNVQGLEKAMAAQFERLKAKGKTDRDADDDAENIDGILHNELPKSVAERELREKIVSEAGMVKKIDDLCRLYLGWGDSENIEMIWWAARQLRRASRDGKNEMILTSLKSVAKEIDAAGLSDEEKFVYRLRSARAVRFFGGTLSTKERFVLSQPDEGQIDVLYRESQLEAV